METKNIEYSLIELNNNNQKKGYLVIDLENNTINCDIVQFAYIVYDDNNKEMKRFNHYVKNRYASKRTCEITNGTITTDILQQKGILLIDIFNEFFKDLNKVSFICGHNVKTDINKIYSNLQKYKIKLSIDILDELIIKDTITLYKQYKKTTKSISLTDLYKELFKKTISYAHDALYDVIQTAECYAFLQKQIDDSYKKNEIVEVENTINMTDLIHNNFF